MSRSLATSPQLTVTGLCTLAGFSRQAYYKATQRRQQRATDEQLLIDFVRQQRQLHPHMGTRKLLHLAQPMLREAQVHIGRDQCFALLRKKGLLVSRRKAYRRTTNSNHRFKTYKNLIRDYTPKAPHQLWVSDITYIRTRDRFLYLSLITDAYSRKIIGHNLSDSLRFEGAFEALHHAFAQLPQGAKPIHHSDRGIQYCNTPYADFLEQNGCPISMTEENHCYENAKAERINGILKNEYGLGATLLDSAHAHTAVQEAIHLYNSQRPHLRLNYNTPDKVHLGTPA